MTHRLDTHDGVATRTWWTREGRYRRKCGGEAFDVARKRKLGRSALTSGRFAGMSIKNRKAFFLFLCSEDLGRKKRACVEVGLVLESSLCTE